MNKDIVAPDRQPAPLWRPAAALAVLFLLDLGFAGQGLFSMFVAIGGFGLLTTRALWAAVRGRSSALIRARSMRASLYLLLGVATVITMRFHTATARNHAEQVIAACGAYQ